MGATSESPLAAEHYSESYHRTRLRARNLSVVVVCRTHGGRKGCLDVWASAQREACRCVSIPYQRQIMFMSGEVSLEALGWTNRLDVRCTIDDGPRVPRPYACASSTWSESCPRHVPVQSDAANFGSLVLVQVESVHIERPMIFKSEAF